MEGEEDSEGEIEMDRDVDADMVTVEDWLSVALGEPEREGEGVMETDSEDDELADGAELGDAELVTDCPLDADGENETLPERDGERDLLVLVVIEGVIDGEGDKESVSILMADKPP